MDKTTIYVVKLWGIAHAFYTTKEAAKQGGRDLKEPTSHNKTYTYYSYTIEEWIEGTDTQHAKSWTYEYKQPKDE